MRVAFTIPGEPHGWKTKRTTGIAGHASQYDPAENKHWRAQVQHAAAPAFSAGPTLGAVVLEIEAVFTRPKSHYGAKGVLARAPQRKTSKPDCSNLVKGIEDSLKGIAWHDDAQVTHLMCLKRYANEGEQARTEVVVFAVETAAKEATG